jgi:hypothetical protein
LRIKLGNGPANTCFLRFLVFDDGIAYRYEASGSGEVMVIGQNSGFRVPQGATAWMGAALFPDEEFFPSFEPYYRPGPAGLDSPLDGYYLPAASWDGERGLRTPELHTVIADTPCAGIPA